MTKEDLIKEGSSKVRNNSTLLSFYIDIFKSEFGYKPTCAGCTFSTDWNKLINSTKKHIEIMNATFEIKDKQKIHTFYKDKRNIRCYGRNMTEEFAIDYLTFGTAEEIEERKKDFRKLPVTEIEVVDAENETGNELTFKDLKELYPQFSDAKNKKQILALIEKLEN